MKQVLACALMTAAVMVASGSAAASADAVYQRVQSDGAVSLTNVPDNDGYQVLVAGAHAGVAAEGANVPGPSTAVSVGEPNQTQAMALPVPESAAEPRPEPVAPRLAETPPSIEARTGKLLDPAVAPTVASALANQAQEQISSAGGTQARLLNLYQASMSAFQAKGNAPQDRR